MNEGCSTTSEHQHLTKRVENLEQEVEQLRAFYTKLANLVINNTRQVADVRHKTPKKFTRRS